MDMMIPPERSLAESTAGMLPKSLPRTRYEIARGVAIIAGIFCALVVCLMVYYHFHDMAADPLNSEELKRLKSELIEHPQDETLIARIRQLDLHLRRTYFRYREFYERGAFLLIGGVAVLLAGLKLVVAYQQQLPMPPLEEQNDSVQQEEINRSFQAVVLIGMACAGIALIGAWVSSDFLTGTASDIADLPPFASAEQMAKNWPRFRGPGGLGVAAVESAPQQWNGDTDEGVLWQAAIPLPGRNSPVVWENRVFVSGATEERRGVYCFDTDSGKLLWEDAVTDVPGSPTEPPEVMEDTGYAAPTMATNGRYVAAIFANGDLVCYTLTGQRVWSLALGLPDNMYGYASSLSTYQDLLLVLNDQADADAGLSSLMAFDMATGRLAWETDRDVPNSWASPSLIDMAGNPQVVACGDPWVIAYHPRTGEELWRVECLSGDIAPSPTFADGRVFVTNDYAVLAAIRPDGDGNVTETHIEWTAEDNLPDIPSPVASDEFVFLLMTYGTLTCYDAGTGEMLWEEELDAEFNASPILVGDTLYLLSVEGTMFRVAAEREYRLLGQSVIEDTFRATPAFVEDRIYLRAEEKLYCVGTL